MENYHVVKSTKSVGLGILLTLFLGPIGLFYSSVWGGIIMTFGHILLLGILLLGIYLDNEFIQIMSGVTIIVFLVFGWLICMIWSAIAVKQYNRRIMNQSNYNISYHPINPTPESRTYLESHFKQLSTRETNLLPEENVNNVAPSARDWLKANPDKGINDYYIKFRK